MSTPRPEPKNETGTPTAELPVRRHWAALLLVFLLGFALRAQGVDHGMPRNYVPDTHIVRSALGMAQEKSLAPPVGVYSTYPNLLPYCLLPLYATDYMVGRITGEWDGSEGYKQHLLDHPEGVHGIARWLMVLFGALTPLVILKAAQAAGLQRGAWAAAWFSATGLMHVHFSVQERPWVAMVFFAALSAWPAAQYVRDPRQRHLILAGVCAGLSAACHQSGLFVLALPGLAWLVSPLKWSGTELLLRLKQGVLCVFLFGLVAALLGYPSYLIHGAPSAAQTIGGDSADLAIGGQSINFARNWSAFPRLARSFFGYGPVLSIFALAGLVPLLRRRLALPAGLFALGWGAFFMTHSNEHIRYLLPLAVLGSLPAGLFVERCLDRGRLTVLVVSLLALVPLVQSYRLGNLLNRGDTRVSGEAWIAALPDDARVLVDRYGPIVPQDSGSLELLMKLREATNSELYGREARRLAVLLDGAADDGEAVTYASDLMVMDELAGTLKLHAGLDELCGSSPADALSRLGISHVLIVNRLRPGLEGNLLAELIAGAELLQELSPSEQESTEARLPMELSFALTSLWQLQRPGPWLGLYQLP